MTSNRLEVQRTIAADPATIFIPEGALRATPGILARTIARGHGGPPA
jgi:hypothetical protein